MECIQPTDVDLRKVRILSDDEGQGKKLKVAIQNLDSLGYIQGPWGFLTDTEIMNIVRYHLELSDSIAESKSIKDAASDEKKDDHETNITEIAPKEKNF